MYAFNEQAVHDVGNRSPVMQFREGGTPGIDTSARSHPCPPAPLGQCGVRGSCVISVAPEVWGTTIANPD